MRACALIFAGGTGSRMQSEKPKQFLEVDNKPIIVHTLDHFQKNESVNDIVVVCKEDWIDYLNDLISKYKLDKVKWVVPGGSTGQLSIYNGLMKLKKELPTVEDTVVLIHDGVRPVINQKVINENIKTVQEKGTSITVTPAIETVITIDDKGMIKDTVERAKCRMAKAPQCFWLKDIISVHEDAYAKGNTNMIDSATLMSSYGYKLHTVDGPSENLKITTPIDYYTFKTIYQILKENENFQVKED